MPWHNVAMQPVRVQLPKKPRIVQAEALPDQRKFIVMPFRAATDYDLTHMQLRVLMVLCSYCNRGGIAWVGTAKIAELMGKESSNIGRHLKNLEKKGYIRIVCKGFKGMRAHTRQVIFDPAISADDAAAISGEAAPYQLRQQSATIHSFNTERHIMARKKKQTATLDAGNLGIEDNIATSLELNSMKQWQALERAVGAEVFQLAKSQCGEGATLDQVQTKLKELLS